MFNKKFTYLLVFILICSYCSPIFATDSIFVWSDTSAPQAITTSALLR